MSENSLKYFLAANSCSGFVSYFDNCYDAVDGWRAYIIKGGPGTGKSYFMKFLMKKGLENGFAAEVIPCSSDPDSLDAVIFPDIKTVIMDGTAPHTVDPKYPGVCEQILNFGLFWSEEKFFGREESVIALTDTNKLLHKRASCYLKAAGQFFADNFKIAEACTDRERLNTFINRLCKKYIPNKAKKLCGKEKVRFLSGITPRGLISYPETVFKCCKRVVIISDEFGSVSNSVMTKLREYACQNGYNITTIKNALLPNTLIDGVILPELSLGFIRESEQFVLNSDIRRVHARRFVHAEQLSKSRKRIKFNKKAAAELLLAVTACLKEAKSVHDELEKEYINAMNFDKLECFAEQFSQKLFKK